MVPVRRGFLPSNRGHKVRQDEFLTFAPTLDGVPVFEVLQQSALIELKEFMKRDCFSQGCGVEVDWVLFEDGVGKF